MASPEEDLSSEPWDEPPTVASQLSVDQEPRWTREQVQDVVRSAARAAVCKTAKQQAKNVGSKSFGSSSGERSLKGKEVEKPDVKAGRERLEEDGPSAPRHDEKKDNEARPYARKALTPSKTPQKSGKKAGSNGWLTRVESQPCHGINRKNARKEAMEKDRELLKKEPEDWMPHEPALAEMRKDLVNEKWKGEHVCTVTRPDGKEVRDFKRFRKNSVIRGTNNIALRPFIAMSKRDVLDQEQAAVAKAFRALTDKELWED